MADQQISDYIYARRCGPGWSEDCKKAVRLSMRWTFQNPASLDGDGRWSLPRVR